MKLLLVCSSGGHLLLLHQLRPWWEKHERSWVTFDKTDARSLLEGERLDWAHHTTQRNIPNLLRNLRLAWRPVQRFELSLVGRDLLQSTHLEFVSPTSSRRTELERAVYTHVSVAF